MGNTLRCCSACKLPCGALDVIRVVHLNGHVQEISHPVTAREVLLSNPGHVLTNPRSKDDTLPPRVLVLSPNMALRKGTVYFLIPDKGGPRKGMSPRSSKSNICSSNSKSCGQVNGKPSLTIDDEHQMTGEHVRKRKERKRRRRSGSRSTEALWRPHLESISED